MTKAEYESWRYAMHMTDNDPSIEDEIAETGT